MSLSFASDCVLSDRPSRRAKAPTFDEATACVDEALDALRAAEESLERQLADLRRYLNDGARGGASAAVAA